MKECWNQKNEIPLNDKNFYKILNFYLFNCPCERERRENGRKKYEKISCRAKTLRDKGWTNSNLRILLSAMKKTASRHMEYKILESSQKIDEKENNINYSLSDDQYEMIIVCKRNDMNLTSAIFYYIRNAFAHGSFYIINKTYYFESSKKETIKGKLRLKEKTLLKWIELFELSPKVLRSQSQVEKKHKRKRLVEV